DLAIEARAEQRVDDDVGRGEQRLELLRALLTRAVNAPADADPGSVVRERIPLQPIFSRERDDLDGKTAHRQATRDHVSIPAVVAGATQHDDTPNRKAPLGGERFRNG